ncbi:MAG TPA: hypothetical protein VM328_04440, partial [Fimbriimonadaceae bacterium]|nr:hypothetical protein [Fimbriimonadaceae bacterium]
VITTLAGVVVCFFLGGDKSLTLAYVVWVVFGIFGGLFSYNSAGAALTKTAGADWLDSGTAATLVGKRIIVSSFALFAGLSLLLYVFSWRHGGNREPLPPFNMGVTLTLFGTMLITMALTRNLFKPEPKPAGGDEVSP